MGYVDVLIPGVVGLSMVAWPAVFTKPTGDVDIDAQRQRKMRGIGFLLLGVAALYLFIKTASRT